MRRGDGCRQEKNNSDNATCDNKDGTDNFSMCMASYIKARKKCYQCSKDQTLMPEFRGHNKNKFGRKYLPDKAQKSIKIYHN